MRKIATNDELMTTREAAEALGVAVRTVQLWVESGVLTAWKTAGGHRRIARAALDELLVERNKVMHPTTPESELPARNRRAVDAAAPPEVLKLLIVEDDPNIMRLYQMWVQSWNFKVDLTLAHNGYEGLLLIGQLRPDVVLTDLMMPGMDGFQLVRSLKGSKLGFASVKLVVVSSLSRQDIQNRGGLPEDVDIFEKPIPFDRIEAIVLQEVKQLTASRA
ncbi:MAG: response regulator, partial [Betaproteobacteria bacterium]|nr:response regulator [Betaproteobacteria bacterium]